MKENIHVIVESLLNIQARLEASLPVRKRLIQEEDFLNKRAVILVGPRGTGKSTFLLSIAEKLPGKSFYLSLDNPIVAGISLFELGDWIFQNGYDTLICDEVHYNADWSTHLKALYDSHPQKQIWASDSSTLVLKKGVGDLSRRFLIRELHYLSFREYLWLKEGIKFNNFSLEDILEKQVDYDFGQISSDKSFNLQREFKEYINYGLRPFFLEGDYTEKLRNIVEKVIHVDISHFLPEIKERHLNLMRHVVGYLSVSPIPVINVESLAKTWSVAKLTVYNLLAIMENTGLINIIRYEGVKKGQSKGAKIFFADPSLYAEYNGALCNMREAYFCMTLKNLHQNPCCPKDDSEYDFSVDGSTFEIGGRSKKAKKANFVVRDDIDVYTKKTIPLWLLGML